MMATLHDENVPDDERVMDATSIPMKTTMPFDDGTTDDDDASYDVVPSFSLPAKFGLTDGTTPIKPNQGRNLYSYNNATMSSYSYTPETKATAATASPSMMDSPYYNDGDNEYACSSEHDDDDDDGSSSSQHHHDQNNNTYVPFQSVQSTLLSRSFQSVQSTLLSRFSVVPSLVEEEDMAASEEYQTQSAAAICDSLPDSNYLGTEAYDKASLSQAYLGSSSTTTKNNEQHNSTSTTRTQEEETPPPLIAESSSSTTSSTQTNTANNKETRKPLAAASSEKVGVVSRQSSNSRVLQAQEQLRQKRQPLAAAASSERVGGVSRRQTSSRVLQAQEQLRQKLTRLGISLPTTAALATKTKEPKRPPVDDDDKVLFSNNSITSEKETPPPRSPPKVTEEQSAYTNAFAPWVSYSGSNNKARTAVRRAEEDLKQVFCKLGFWDRSSTTVGEESSSNSSTSNQSEEMSGVSSCPSDEQRGVSLCPSDEQRGRDRPQPPTPPSLLDLPSSSSTSHTNSGMDESSSEDGLLFGDIGVLFDDVGLFIGDVVGAVAGNNRPATPRPRVPELSSRVAANNGGRAATTTTRDADLYHPASVPTMVRVIPRSSRTRIYVDPASGERMANQSSFSGSSFPSEPEIYLNDPEDQVFGESNDNEAAAQGMSICMPVSSECGGIVMVETYEEIEIEAQTSPWSMNHPKGDPTTDKKTLSKKSATSWIIANKTLLILILLITSAAFVLAILGFVVTRSIRERSQSDSGR